MFGAPYPFLLLPNRPRNLQIVDLPIPSVLPRLARTVEVHHRTPCEADISPIFEMSLRSNRKLRPLDAPTITESDGDEPVVTREGYCLAYASSNILVNDSVVDFDVQEDTGDIVHDNNRCRRDPCVLVRAPVNHWGLAENHRRAGRRDASRRQSGEKDEKDQANLVHNASSGQRVIVCIFCIYYIILIILLSI